METARALRLHHVKDKMSAELSETCLVLSATEIHPSASELASTLTTFSLFVDLPTEIRLKIWNHALQPRTVTLYYSKRTHAITSPTAASRLLSVNHEARYEALRFCSPTLATSTSPASVYLAGRFDSIYIPRIGAMGYDNTLRDFKSYLANPHDLDEISELALDYVESGDKRPWEAYDKSVLIRSFPNLKIVILVLGWKPGHEGHQNGRKEEVGFGNARDDLMNAGMSLEMAETSIQKFESEFKGAWDTEESIAREVAEVRGEIWTSWKMPEVKVVGKMREREFLKVL